MDNQKSYRVGLIGCGSITEFIHIPGLLLCPEVEIAIACDSDAGTAQKVAKKYGISRHTTNYLDVLNDNDISAVIIATPNHLHKPISMEAIKKGKHILCEKPIGLNLSECNEMVTAVKGSGLINMVSFVYRYTPAMRYMKYLIEQNVLGEIRHFRASYLQSVPDFYLGWRSDITQNGEAGALGDVGVHLIDFARYLVGDISSVSGWVKTFLPKRRLPGKDTYIDCVVDDAAGYLAEFENGATGVFEVSRLALGRGCGQPEYQYVEINGSKSTAVYHLQDPFRLQICPGKPIDEDQLVTVNVPDSFLKSTRSPRKVTADAPNLGFRYDQAFDFIQAIKGNDQGDLPDFVDGQKAQAVVDAILRSNHEKRWVSV
jgi:predicted dehydrogenase